MNKELFLHFVLLGATILLLPQAAFAHAMPEAEDPKVGSSVTSPPQQAAIRFDAPIEALFSRLDVLNSNGQSEADGASQVNMEMRMLTVSLKPLSSGEYTVKWS